MFLEWLGLLTLIFLLETREWLLEKGRIRSVAGWTQTWITVPQLWQCLEFFLYSVQCSRYKARQCLVFIYEWIHVAAWHVKWWFVRCVCERSEREREKGWIEEFHWIEWMPFLWPLNKMTYFTDRTLFFCREYASPLPVLLLSLFQDIVSLYVCRLLSLCI